MCISTPKVGATSTPTPTDSSATDIQTGASSALLRSGGIFGRLALTGGQRSARKAPTMDSGSSGSPSDGSSGTTPGGTLGLPSDYFGRPIYGGLPDNL